MDILETVKTAMMFACGNKLGTIHFEKIWWQNEVDSA